MFLPSESSKRTNEQRNPNCFSTLPTTLSSKYDRAKQRERERDRERERERERGDREFVLKKTGYHRYYLILSPDLNRTRSRQTAAPLRKASFSRTAQPAPIYPSHYQWGRLTSYCCYFLVLSYPSQAVHSIQQHIGACLRHHDRAGCSRHDPVLVEDEKPSSWFHGH